MNWSRSSPPKHYKQSRHKFKKQNSVTLCYLPLICEGRRDVIALSCLFQGVAGSLELIPVVTVGEGRVHPWTSCQVIAWPLLMADVPTAHQEQFWGSISCSRILRHAAQFCPRGAGIWTSDLPITSRTALPAELQLPQKRNISPLFFTVHLI